MKPKWPKRGGKTSRINQQKLNIMRLKTILGIIVGIYLSVSIIVAIINLWKL
jgi:hypothetical protein